MEILKDFKKLKKEEFERDLKNSKSYALYAKQYLFNIDLGILQIEYQEYNKINEQHMYSINEFVNNKDKEEARIELKIDNDIIIYKNI